MNLTLIRSFLIRKFIFHQILCFVRGRSRGGHSRRGDYRPPRDSRDRDQRRRSDVYPGQARDFEVRRERGVADPRREADGHPRYRQVTSNYHRP